MLDVGSESLVNDEYLMPYTLNWASLHNAHKYTTPQLWSTPNGGRPHIIWPRKPTSPRQQIRWPSTRFWVAYDFDS